MRRFLTGVLLISTLISNAQKVALVLSGGAAKGIAHVGVLKALEEHEIPIDYIVGTSMGAIIGGCYAAGMSPDQIETMIMSEDFLRWVTGRPEKGYNFHYYGHDVSPGFLHLNLSLDTTNTFQFYQSIASDASLNFALTEKMAAASGISRNNFDSLFVPLRVVAADVFSQTEVILSGGSLSEALRASQTVPFFYTPIRIDGKYLFDGGIYNNFPVSVAQESFSPDVIIGSNVSSKVYKEYPYDEDDKLINRSLLYMILDKSDPSDIPESGVYIQPNLTGYTSFDFAQARALIDSGYIQTIRQLNEIREKIEAKESCDSISQRRNVFNNRSVPFMFDGIQFRGFSDPQQRYIRSIFKIRQNDAQDLSLNQVKEGYFNLVGEPYFDNIFPTIQYRPYLDKYVLQLVRRPRKNFQVDFGGVIASRNVSNIFLGLNYYHFRSTLTHAYIGFQTGSFYKSLSTNARIDLPYFGRMYVQPEFERNIWDYIESTELLVKTEPTVLKRSDNKYGVTIGWPMGNKVTGTMGIHGLSNKDSYSNEKKFVSTDTLDELRINGWRTGFELTTNTLNRKQYASEGKAVTLGVYYFNVTQDYIPGSTSDIQAGEHRKHQWFRVRGTVEHYANLGRFRPGYYIDAVFSNQPFFQNYVGTIVNAPAFSPLQDSRTLILENFRSFNYIGVGSRNVLVLKPRAFDLRIEAYLFKPIEYIAEGTNQEAYSNTEFSKVFLAGTAGLVYHSPIGPISLSANYYNDPQYNFGVLFHVGYLLFNRHSMD